MYYPPNKIKPNQYTNGGDYVTKDKNISYTGYYFITFDNRAFTGKNIDDTNNIELIKLSKETSTNDYTFIGDEFYSNYLKLQDSEIQKLPKYSIPKSFQPIPNNKDYSIGYFTRYFFKRVNGSEIQEIDKTTFNDINQGEKYNKVLYNTVSIIWYISGPLKTTINNGIITRGVETKNFELVNRTEQIFIGIKQYLNNYTEFYK